MTLNHLGHYTIQSQSAVNIATTNITPDPNRTPEQTIRHAMMLATENLIHHLKDMQDDDKMMTEFDDDVCPGVPVDVSHLPSQCIDAGLSGRLRQVPQFPSSWSRGMAEAISHWPYADIMANLERMCASWGDKGKFDRPLMVLLNAVPKHHHTEVQQRVVAWAGANVEDFPRLEVQ